MKITLRILVLLVSMPNIVAFSLREATAFGSKAHSSRFMGKGMRLVQKSTASSSKSTTTTMFLGSDGGILGIGAPEVATIILVGYFILGPSDLYKLTKEIGKFIQNFRALGAEATKTLETNMESQLQLDEIRKAQRELNDAFSFRRTINVDDEGEAFSTIPSETRPGAEPIVQPSTDGKKKRKKVRRRKVVVDEEEEEEIPPRVDMESVMMNSELGMDVPDLDMSDVMSTDDVLLRQERMERLKGEAKKPLSFEDSFSDQSIPDELDRFSQQLSGDWNARIMANEAKLEPLALLMERLAILEDEKNAADARLEEEFRLRAELEEKYYKSKRQILEEAAAKVQEDAYVNLNASDQAA